MSHRRFLVVCLTASFALLSGCGESAPADDPNAAEIARLAKAVDELSASNQALRAEVRRQGRQLGTIGRDAASSTGSGAGIVARGGGSDAPSAGDTATPGDSSSADLTDDAETLHAAAIDSFAATDEGRAAIQKAAASEIAKREAQERRTFVSYSIGMFAQKVGLDERQTDDLQRIWKESLDGGVKLRKQFAELRELPEAKRAEARAEAMQFMRDLGRERSEKIADVLTPAQLELYEPTETEIVASLHGAPRGTRPRPGGERESAE